MPSVTQETWNTWNTLSEGIRQGYATTGELDDIITTLNGGEYNPAQMSQILDQLPEMVEIKNVNGDVINRVYKNNTLYDGSSVTSGVIESGTAIPQQINSNVGSGVASQTKTIQTQRVLNVTKDVTTGKATISDELFKWRGGSPTPSTVKMVASNVASGVIATSVGISLGKTVAGVAYSVNPDFWDSINMSTLNPETWNTLFMEDTTYDQVATMLLGIDDVTGNPQPYIDENLFAYITSYMFSQEMFDGKRCEVDDVTTLNFPNITQPIPALTKVRGYYEGHPERFTDTWGVGSSPVYVTSAYPEGVTDSGKFLIAVSKNPFVLHELSYDGTEITRNVTGQYRTKNGNPFYYYGMAFFLNDYQIQPQYFCGYPLNEMQNMFYDIAEILLYGNMTEGVDGIDDQAGATQFDTSNLFDASDINATLLALKDQFPALWDNRVEFSPDGETTKIYIPVGFPTGGTTSQPTTEGATQAQPSPQIDQKGDNVTEELVKSLIDMMTKNSPALNVDPMTPANIGGASPNEFNTGTGSTPAIVTPTGSASALWKIYNPSQSELDIFGAWLWSSNFVDQLLKVFNDPMQAIIGLHKIFCTPSVSGSGVIKVGYLSSNATANYVDDQYVDVDCGSVDLYEFYGNVFDYEPFTRLQLFLPFIGFVGLSTSDCTRGKIKVKYRVDVLTGQCLATVSVVRDMHENILYTYAGNCAVQYPVSSGSYVGIIGGLLGIAGTIASGGALAPVAIGAMAGIGGIHTDVKHSGSIQGSAGAMGCKKPYLVIERPQTAMPNNGELIEGLPQNETVTLGSCSGFVKVKKATYNISALDVELDMIKSLLENGVYI